MSDPSVQAVPRPGGPYRQTAWLPTLLILSLTTIGHTAAECSCSGATQLLSATTIYQTFTSPNYGLGQYPPTCECQWKITSTTGSVTFIIEDMRLEKSSWTRSADCDYDYVHFTDAGGFNKKLCDKPRVTKTFDSVDKTVTVKFHSDYSNQKGGFKIGYQATGSASKATQGSHLAACDCVRQILAATPDVRTLTSPNFGNGLYPPSCNCEWIVQSYSQYINFTILKMDLEQGSYVSHTYQPQKCQYDNVTFIDGNYVSKTLCTSSKPFESAHSRVTVTFRSDGSVQRQGFKVEYQASPATPNSLDGCTRVFLEATETSKDFHSPNYPHIYPENCKAEWLIESNRDIVELTLQEVDLERSTSCLQDSIKIFDGLTKSPDNLLQKVCDSSSPTKTLKTTGRYATVEFSSISYQLPHRGFSIAYRSAAMSCPTHAVVIEASNSYQSFDSPGYPYRYPGNTICVWHIVTALKNIVIKIETLNLRSNPDCSIDHLEIVDGDRNHKGTLLAKLCVLLEQHIFRSTSQTLTIRLHTGGGTVDRSGFRIGYLAHPKSTTPQPACSHDETIHLEATAQSKVLESPNYPQDYPPNSDCAWLITSTADSVSLKFEVVEIEFTALCAADTLMVYDGTTDTRNTAVSLCNYDVHDDTYRSQAKFVFISFHSDDSDQGRGFRIRYSAVEANDIDNEPHTGSSHGLTTTTAVAVIMGVVIVLLFFVLLVIMAVRRNQRIRRQTGMTAHGPTSHHLSNFATFFPGGINPACDSNDLPPSYDEVIQTGPPLPPPPPYSAFVNGNTGETPNSDTNNPPVFTVSHNEDENKDTRMHQMTPTVPHPYRRMTSSDGATATQLSSDESVLLQFGDLDATAVMS